jgi:hypothetical protein
MDLNLGALLGDFPGFHIDPMEINDLIEAHGIGAELRVALTNPNQRIETHVARTNGYGRGLPFVYPLAMRKPIVCVIQNRGPKRELVMAGDVTTGQAWALFPIGIHPADGDLILPDGEEHIVQETITRLENQIDDTKLRGRLYSDRVKPPPKSKPRPERLLYPDPCCIDALVWTNATDTGLCYGREGFDYTINANGEILWVEGHGPAAGLQYTVKYRAPAAYVCSPAAPIFRSEGGRAMPYRCQVQRLDRWGTPDPRENA